MEPTTTKTNQPAAASPEAGTDCERVSNILDQIIEGQAPSAEDEDYFVHHAEDCSPCFDTIEKQKVFIGFLSQHVGRKGAPAVLSQTILQRLQAEMA